MTGRWTAAAACRDQDPELFFPVGTGPDAAAQTAEAKAICRHCPVADACLQQAAALGIQDGVWGGLSEAERRRAHRGQTSHGGSRAKAPCGTRAAYLRHIRRSEDIDEACRAANAGDKAARQAVPAKAPGPGPWAGRVLEPCGTRAAYRRHVRHGEEPCRACREAERQARYEREARAKQAVA